MMNILILRTTPNHVDLKHYNIQEIGLAKALIRKGHVCDVAFYGGNKADRIQEYMFDNDRSLKIIWLRGFGAFYEVFFPTLHNYVDNYDIIQVGGYVGITSCYLNRKAKNKTVNYNGLYYCKDNLGDIKKAKVWDKILLPLQCKKKMVVGTKSVLATEYLKNKGIQNVTTIGVGLDLDNLRGNVSGNNIFVEQLKSKKDNHKYLLYIGVLEPRRNILFLLEVFSEILKKDVNYRLVLIGKGKDEYTKQVDGKIEELGIEDKIIRSTKVEQKFLPEIYKTCDAFLLPTRYEIFGMVLLEAMYYGLPVFTTYNGGSSTIMDENHGVVVPELNIEKWSQKVIEVLSDTNKTQYICQNACKKIENEFTWDALSEKFLDVYKERLKMSD